MIEQIGGESGLEGGGREEDDLGWGHAVFEVPMGGTSRWRSPSIWK